MTTKISTFVLAMTLVAPVTSFAGGDATAGSAKAKSLGCTSCHGEDGNGVTPRVPNVPKLAGQYESYLIRALIDYKSGKRSNAIMSGFSANLTARDRDDIAAYYASQPGLRVIGAN